MYALPATLHPPSRKVSSFQESSSILASNVHQYLCTILGEGKCRWFPVSRISVPISNRDTMLLLYMYTQHTSMSELRNTIVSIIVNTYRIQGHSLTFLTPGLGKIYCQYYEDWKRVIVDRTIKSATFSSKVKRYKTSMTCEVKRLRVY